MKLTLIAGTRERVAELVGQLSGAGDDVRVDGVVGSVRELAAAIEGSSPDLVVLDPVRLGSIERVELERALVAAPALPLILLSPDRSPELLLWAMRVGVREVVSGGNDELRTAVERHVRRVAGARTTVRQGRVLAFLPAKGGSGATFLAANTACALAARGKRVALIDLNLHLGDAALFVSEAQPTQTIADLSKDLARIDGTFLETGMMQARPNLWVLPAPESPEGALEIRPEAIEKIVAVARERFDFVILDVGRVLEASGLRGLDAAETIYLVVQLTLPFVHDAKRLKKMLRSLGYSRDKLRLVINRYERGTDVTSGDVERALGMRADLRVPNEFAPVAFSINHAVPVFEHQPKCAVSRAVLELADRYAPAAAPTKGLLSGLTLRFPKLTSAHEA